ncbi:MAG: response regulator, partial [Candidatus Hydrogenedentes bacterium]|nr:response regulator [Candidatus Hydrogenedentota bacterium]
LLMGVLGHASLALLELPPESPVRESLNQIELAAQRAAELSKQMLAYSGRGAFVVQPLNLSTLVEEMAHLVQVSISKKAMLRYNFAREVPAIEGDSTQIRQVAMNLITNASDALEEKAGVITVGTGTMELDTGFLQSTYFHDDLPPGTYVFLEVNDTGCGMDPQTLERIFEPFFTTKFTGRGLGMAAVMGVVRGHRGAIKIESEPGRGTTVRIWFPACPQMEPLSPTADEKTRDWAVSGTVLVVDDETAVRNVAKLTLERHGMAVLTAADGQEGLELYRAHHNDILLVLLDLTMPRLSGEEVFREIRKINPEAVVLLSSGYGEPEATGYFKHDSPAGFIQKPYRAAELLAKTRALLAPCTR